MIKNIKSGYYNSTYDFVNRNKLEDEANKCFGSQWEAEFDVEQIKELLNYIGRDEFIVNFIENKDEDDIQILSISENVSLDELKDLAVRITGNLVIKGLIKDCTDTNDDTEFEIQDQMLLDLGLYFGYSEDEIINN